MASAPSQSDLETFFADEQERKRLQRAADDLESKNRMLKGRILDHVRKHGGRDRTAVTHGFVLKITERAGSAPWKDKYIEVAGVDAAEELRKSAKPIEILTVERAVA